MTTDNLLANTEFAVTYQRSMVADGHYCPACGGAGFRRSLNHDPLPPLVICDRRGCLAGDALPPRLRRAVQDGAVIHPDQLREDRYTQ